MRGLPKTGSMSEAAPILIQLKQWCEKKWVSVAHFKTVTDDMHDMQTLEMNSKYVAPDESVFEVRKDNAVADAFLGCKLLCHWTAVGWIEGESHPCVCTTK